MTGPGRVVGWFAPVLPDARVAVLRTVVYLFVLVDIHLFVADPIPLSRQPDLYAPLMVERLFLLPPPTPLITTTLYVVLVVGSLVAAANRLPRLAGVVVAAAFTWWTAIGMSYGKVDHDHLAFVVALWLLPTRRGRPGPLAEPTSSAAGGLGAQVRADRGDRDLLPLGADQDPQRRLEPDRRGRTASSSPGRSSGGRTGWASSCCPFPDLLRGMQWFAFLAELTSLVVLWLRGRALLAAALFWLGFHVFTAAILYIHFAPTLVCWLAFAPLERLPAWWDRRRAARAARTGRVVDAADVRAS